VAAGADGAFEHPWQVGRQTGALVVLVGAELSLLGGFEIRCAGAVLTLPFNAERVVAFIALHEPCTTRIRAASALWPDATETHAGANLRSALWRLKRLGDGVLSASGYRLSLARGATVDVRCMTTAARRILDPSDPCDDLGLDPGGFAFDLLPGWDEEWLLIDRERLTQMRLHALEALSERLVARGRYAEAVEAGLLATRGEPLRESSHRSLIKAHLAEGNVVDAMRVFRRFRMVLRDELGLEPSRQMKDLVRGMPSKS
jgi:DNA-binding SARP family transcriptional activator